jgi:phosphoglycolate phosphatase-like HAD superfamily hydrolase
MMVLFWDIDGTLITTGRAGMFAWNDAVKELSGHSFDLKTSIRTAGFTDYQIAVKTFEYLGIDFDDALVERLVRCYEELLPASLPRRQGRVLDNVLEILEYLQVRRPDIRSHLLTGNTQVGARTKLTYYGLMEFFSAGAFCVDTSRRESIATRALALARRSGFVANDAVFVIGDTPHDIECAVAIDARTIAVATGGYSLRELKLCRPWQAFNSLPPPEVFVRLLDSAGDTDASPGSR